MKEVAAGEMHCGTSWWRHTASKHTPDCQHHAAPAGSQDGHNRANTELTSSKMLTTRLWPLPVLVTSEGFSSGRSRTRGFALFGGGGGNSSPQVQKGFLSLLRGLQALADLFCQVTRALKQSDGGVFTERVAKAVVLRGAAGAEGAALGEGVWLRGQRRSAAAAPVRVWLDKRREQEGKTQVQKCWSIKSVSLSLSYPVFLPTLLLGQTQSTSNLCDFTARRVPKTLTALCWVVHSRRERWRECGRMHRWMVGAEQQMNMSNNGKRSWTETRGCFSLKAESVVFFLCYQFIFSQQLE